MVEKEKGLKIKSMRSDRGGEFLSKEFNKFCEDNGIQRFLTAPYSPQQNGVVERKNRTILNMVRSMLKSKKMPKEFWAEVVDCAHMSTSQAKVTRKVVVSRDVEFKEGSWDWSIEENERYDFLPMTDKEETGELGDEVQQPESPTPTPTQDSPLSSSEGEPKTRFFEEAMKSKKWRQAIEEEIKSIEKHDTWELTTLSKGYWS
ncbi:retrovirus-related pol polyprotein from transposon TNT 1-94 [Tanacetum coccineum]